MLSFRSVLGTSILPFCWADESLVRLLGGGDESIIRTKMLGEDRNIFVRMMLRCIFYYNMCGAAHHRVSHSVCIRRELRFGRILSDIVFVRIRRRYVVVHCIIWDVLRWTTTLRWRGPGPHDTNPHNISLWRR